MNNNHLCRSLTICVFLPSPLPPDGADIPPLAFARIAHQTQAHLGMRVVLALTSTLEYMIRNPHTGLTRLNESFCQIQQLKTYYIFCLLKWPFAPTSMMPKYVGDEIEQNGILLSHRQVHDNLIMSFMVKYQGSISWIYYI